MMTAAAVENDAFSAKPILSGFLALGVAILSLCFCGLLLRAFIVGLLVLAFAFDLVRHLYALRLYQVAATTLGVLILLVGLVGLLRWPADIHFWLMRPIYQMQVSALSEGARERWHSGWDGGLGYDVSVSYFADASAVRQASVGDGEGSCNITRRHLDGHFYLLKMYC